VSLLECRCRLRYPSGFVVDAEFTTDAAVTALFGPSGAGKTSILSMVAGLRRPQAGTIRLGRRLLFDGVAGVNLAPEARRIGYVFQDQLLFPHLTVRRNLLYGWRRRPPQARQVTVERAVEVLELHGQLDRLPHTLSGGQRQRVALGRALLTGPDLLLLDEPLVALDAALKRRVLDYVEQIVAEWGIPTVYVTHDADDVRRLAGQVVMLDDGRVRAAGKPAVVLMPEPPNCGP
jgi:molybdate transport system ATP-binding protein